MNDVRVVALLKAKTGEEENVKQAVIAVVEPSRKEEGNISYSANTDSKDPSLFVITEHWQSMEIRNKHLQSEHFKKLQQTVDTESRLDSHTFHVLNPLI